MEKLKTKTVGKFQVLYFLSIKYCVCNILAPFLVLAHKENCMSFFVCEIDHKVSTPSCRAIAHRKKKIPSKPSTVPESLLSGRKTVVEKKIFHRAVSQKNGLFCFYTCEKRPQNAILRSFSHFSALKSDYFDFLHTKPFVGLEKTNLLSGETYLNSKGYSRN